MCSQPLASFQLKPSWRHLLLPSFFFFARQKRQAVLHRQILYLKRRRRKKKPDSEHHLFILLHANLILQSGSPLFSAPLVSSVSPCPAACWHFCLILLPDHLAHESLPTVVLRTMEQWSLFQLFTVRPPRHSEKLHTHVL